MPRGICGLCGFPAELVRETFEGLASVRICYECRNPTYIMVLQAWVRDGTSTATQRVWLYTGFHIRWWGRGE